MHECPKRRGTASPDARSRCDSISVREGHDPVGGTNVVVVGIDSLTDSFLTHTCRLRACVCASTQVEIRSEYTLYIELFVVGNAVVAVHDVLHRPPVSVPNHMHSFMREFDKRSDCAASAFAVACIMEPRRMTMCDTKEGDGSVFYTDRADRVLVAIRRRGTRRYARRRGSRSSPSTTPSSSRSDTDKMWNEVIANTTVFIGTRFVNSGPKKKTRRRQHPPREEPVDDASPAPPRDRKRVRVTAVADADADNTGDETGLVPVEASQNPGSAIASGAAGGGGAKPLVDDDDLCNFVSYETEDDNNAYLCGAPQRTPVVVPETPISWAKMTVSFLIEEDEEDE